MQPDLLYTVLWYFILYSAIGWGIEVAYHAVSIGKIINRGFLNGPVCPVYGFGMLSLLYALDQAGISSTSLVGKGTETWGIFFIGMILATAVELVAGWLLNVFFHARWWDYSGLPFNFHGYICAKFSLFWGMGAVLVIRIVHPVIARLCSSVLSGTTGTYILLLLCITFAADTGVSVAIVIGLNKRLQYLNELQASMRTVSNRLSEQIGENTITAAQFIGEQRVQTALARAELSDRIDARKDEIDRSLRQQRASIERRMEELEAEILRRHTFGAARLLRAFPDLRHTRYTDVLEKVREYQKKRREDRA